MILSLLPVSKSKLPFGCLTTKKPTGTVIGLLDAPDWRALLAIVRPPELNAYIFIPAGLAIWANTIELASRMAMATTDTMVEILRVMGSPQRSNTSALLKM